MKKWLIRILLLSLHKADANGDGIVELNIKLHIDSKKVDIDVK